MTIIQSWSSSAPTGTTLSLLDMLVLLVLASVACRIYPETEALGGLGHLDEQPIHTLLN